MNKELDLALQEIEALKQKNQLLKNDLIELSGRTGLVWREQPEHFIKSLSDGDIIYGQSRYKVAGIRNQSRGKKVTVTLNSDISPEASNLEMMRLSDSYLYRVKDAKKVPESIKGKQFLINGDAVYIKICEDLTTYIPKLIKKGNSFGFDDKNGDRNNVLIEGDNYHALQILQHTHKSKIDVICIDPPYNTGNRDFKYNDNFVSDEVGDRHSSWLSFMHKRIKLSKNLLTKDGILMMNIDQNESARATLLCKQIFGDDNVDEIVWKKKGGSSNTEKVLGVITESIIVCYMKRKEGALNYRELERKYTHQDEKGKYNLEGIEKTNEGAYKRETMLFTITCPIGNEYSPADGKRWTLGKETVERLITENKLHFDIKKKKVYRIKRKEDYLESKIPYLNMLEGLGSLKTAKDEVAKLGIPRELFDTPKPIQLIKELLRISAPKNAVVLDFFGGSGTTCHATWDLNKEDNGSRKCIIVTNNENNICEDVTYERLRRCNLPEHGDYQEGLEYAKIEHINIDEINGRINEHNIDFTKQIISLMHNSYKMIEDNDDWFATSKFSVLLNWNKRNEFFEAFKEYDNIALLSHRPRKYNDFVEIATKHNFTQEQHHHFTQDYVEEMKRVLEEQEIADKENLNKILKEQEK